MVTAKNKIRSTELIEVEQKL